MKFGSKEWFEKLEERVKFPAKVAFYFDKEDKRVTSRVIDSKAKVENTRYTDIKPTALAFQIERNLAIICVRQIQSANDFFQTLLAIQEEWSAVVERRYEEEGTA